MIVYFSFQVDVESGTTDIWLPGYQLFASEPKFVPRPGATEEDDGWLLAVLFDSGAPERDCSCTCTSLCIVAQAAGAGWFKNRACVSGPRRLEAWVQLGRAEFYWVRLCWGRSGWRGGAGAR